jgi:uncharacterized lipoprotein YddW (UPF0748 family)
MKQKLADGETQAAPKSRRGRNLIWAALAVLVLLGGTFVANRLGIYPFTLLTSSAAEPELRGLWVQHRSLTDKEKVDEVLRRAEAGRFNAIFANVFVYGQALYHSQLVGTFERVEPGFDPLGYLMAQAHQRGLKVHVWFVSGPVSYRGHSEILASHPDWGLVGPDGKTAAWLNFSRPDVQQFVSDLALEVITKYQVDGVHFDYFRYPGPEWGFDSYNLETFSQEYGFDLNELKYADLPAYAAFNGNPLSQPSTAQVLATFQNGQPAVALNRYGQGQALLLNWDASQRQVAIGSEILKRGLDYLLDEGGPVYLLRSETTLARYNSKALEQTGRWLSDLGWDPTTIGEADLADLSPNAVLVMPNVYLIAPEVAQNLAHFVESGGGVIFIDGPSRSIQVPEVQRITGMGAAGGHFNEVMLMLPAQEHPLIPVSARGEEVDSYERKAEQWREFRRQGLSTLLEAIYQRVKAEQPQVVVSVTITSSQDRAAQSVLQDWSTWLAGGYIDRLIPRGFVDETQSLQPVLAAWQPVMQRNNNITMGLISFVHQDEARVPKTPEQLLAEINLTRAAGSRGFMIFNSDHLSDEQLQTLAADAQPDS